MPVRNAQFERASLTEVALRAWVGAAAPGDQLAYHRGFLAWDLSPEMVVLSRPQRTVLNRVASRARWLSEQGLVHLVQRREGMGDYTYLAITRPRPQTRSNGALQRVLAGAQEVLA